MSNYWKESKSTSPAASSSTDASSFLVPTNKTLTKRVYAAAGWVWAAAGLSVLNLILAYLSQPIRMVYSLFVTELGFEIGRSMSAIFMVLALVVAAVVIAGVTVLGFLIRSYQVWATIVAMVVVALDAALIYFTTTLAGLWPFILHGVAIYFLWMGLKAAQLYQERKKNGQV